MSKLPGAPLQEVIFEVRWALKPAPDGTLLDDGYDLAPGRLSTIIENFFPIYKKVLLPDIPDFLFRFQPQHQYWKGDNVWPVIQLGPGIMTINCTDEHYDWENGFRDLIGNAVGWLLQAYKSELKFRYTSLKYIDAINLAEYGGQENDWQNFINANFNFAYINEFNTRGVQKQIQVNQVFQMEDGSDLQIQIADGKVMDEKAIIWQTAVMKKGDFSSQSLLEWADKAHATTHELFQEMVKPDLYARFSKGKA